MAEVFATAGAAISLAAVAGQLIDGIVKLRAFCNEICDLPNEIKDAVYDLSSLTEIVDSVQLQVKQEMMPDMSTSQTTFKVLDSLEQCSQDVSKVLEEMKIKIGNKKVWGRVKALGLKRRLERLTARAQKVQNFLLIMLAIDNRYEIPATQSLLPKLIPNRALLWRGYEAQKQQATTISTIVNTSPRMDQLTPQPRQGYIIAADNKSFYTTEEDYMALDGVDFDSFQRTSSARSSKSTALRLKFPTWLRSQVWEFHFRQAMRGWDFSIRSYRTIPKDANIFLAIKLGDLAQVRQLLSSGEASIFDRDPWGGTLLHSAAHYCTKSDDSAIIFELLVRSGADINSTSFGGFPAYAALPSSNNILGDSSAKLRLMKSYRIFARFACLV
jgi:hypothetical protein